MPYSAVITGDLIASRSATAADMTRAMDLLYLATTDVETQFGHPLRFTRFRGDGWQVFLGRPGTALQAALILHSQLRAHDALQTRMALGIGAIESRGTASLADASGDAFATSGHALDQIGKRRIDVAGPNVTPVLSALVGLVEHIAFDWTAAQAEAMALQLRMPHATQDDLAKTLNITRQAVQLRLAAAGKAPVMAAVKAFDTYPFDIKPPDD